MSILSQLMQQRLLLQIEYNTEKKAFQEMTEAVGLARKVKRGDAWAPVTVGKSFYNSLNQLCVEIFRTTDEDIEHNFEPGRAVTFSSGPLPQTPPPIGAGRPIVPATEKETSNTVKFLDINGVVSFVEGNRMVVALNKDEDLAKLRAAYEDTNSSQNTSSPLPYGGRGQGVGAFLSFDETTYKMMFDALDRVMKARGTRLAYLRDLFYSNQKAETFTFADVHFPWLNKTQEHAVNEVLRAKDVMVVHGPPGTGKTTTLVEAISETLRRESQVLVCAQSNMAVDWISEQLVDRGINVLRIGNPTRVNDKMLSFTYERRFEAHPDYPQLWSLRKAIRELQAKRRRGNESYHQQLDRLRSRATELEVRINQELFSEARVIASTLVGSANRTLQGMKFTTLFIDEAAQALEAACWIPIRKVSRVIFAGDHCQLPPTVKSIAALKAGLGKTLMERIVDNKPDVVTLLTTQYRMKDEIMRFSSNEFYDGKLKSAPEVAYRGILDYDTPITWYDTSPLPQTPPPVGAGRPIDSTMDIINEEAGLDCHSQDNSSPLPYGGRGWGEGAVGESLVNKFEAELTLSHLQIYLERIGKQRILDERIDVGIISPYRAQVQLLRKLIKKREFFKPYRHLIAVNTVDGFQGQERDIIIISLVRSNDEGQIGFLRDLRRMNVAITRARMKLIIIGSVSTLTRHPFYKRLYDYIENL